MAFFTRQQRKKSQKALLYVVIALVIISFLLTMVLPLWSRPGGLVYVIPVNDEINPGIARFIARGYQQAIQNKANWVILELNTPGGRIDSALKIRDIILESPVPTVVYVTPHRALSAGALITLAGKKVAMTPGTTIGAAEPIILTAGGYQRADEKIISAWTAEMVETARTNGRNPQIAAAMADPNVEIPGLVEKGKLLTLGAEQAQSLGIADWLVSDRVTLLRQLEASEFETVTLQPSVAETLAGWVTGPVVGPLLLTVGLAGLVLEFFTLGWGVAGTIGLLSLGLYFGGHLLAGLAGWESVILFIGGVILLLLEILVIPGVGITGLAGVVAIVASIFLAAGSATEALFSLGVALVGTLVVLIVGWCVMKKRNLWSRLILGTRQENAAGYVAPRRELSQYLGKTGVTLSILRPAGVAEIEGVRLDVVTEGGFIPPKTSVRVVQVEGTRVVVRPVEGDQVSR
ncbi:MAG: nodulation protein NfeD [Firmicutes bacterium]|nr:nodulation protein NfeD [Bacillota bacterium]